MPLDPGFQKANLEHGRELYTQLGCNACHGALGRGDGPSAPTLVDQWSQPIQAADLTQGWSYRSGSAPRDILTRLMTGLDGTPMPSYAEAVSPNEVWDLAYYVHSLQVKPQWAKRVEAVRVSGDLPEDPSDARWQAASRADLRLSSIFYKEGKILPTRVNAISMQALYNEEAILFRLSWHDPSETRTWPVDSLALVFIPEKDLIKVGSLRSWPATRDAPALDYCYWSASEGDAFETNPVGIGAPFGEKIISFETLPIESQAFYAKGQWVLLLKRRLRRATTQPQAPIFIGIAVWDGGNNEVGRRRANSRWVCLGLK